MEYINGYKAEESLYTKDGKEISVLRLEVENEEKVLDEWATHFREQYRYMEDLDFERHGTRRTRQEHLRDYVFPSDSVRPGPSIRVGDFCEILVADYIEFVCNYYVPRIRYRDKFNRNTSPHGSDVLGFKMRKKASTKDEALVFEVKGTSSPTGNPKGYKRLQDEKYVAGSRKEIVNLIKRDSNIRRKIEGVLQNYPTYFSFKFEEIVYE